MNRKKLVVLGSTNIDYVLNIPRFLQPGETLEGTDYQIAFGGKGANQAVAAGRYGANVTFISSLGNDEIGKSAYEQFKKDNIDVSQIDFIPDVNTGVALIFINEKGENMIGLHPGANAHLTLEKLSTKEDIIKTADALLMQLETPMESVEKAAEIAHRNNTRVILNPAPAQSLSDNLLKCIDIITPNETEAEILTGIKIDTVDDAIKASQILHEKGVKIVIITLGKKGAFLSEGHQYELIAGFNVNAIDTVAAGDTFNGVLTTSLLNGDSMKDAIINAHAAAAISVTRKGAQTSVPWKEEVESFVVKFK